MHPSKTRDTAQELDGPIVFRAEGNKRPRPKLRNLGLQGNFGATKTEGMEGITGLFSSFLKE